MKKLITIILLIFLSLAACQPKGTVLIIHFEDCEQEETVNQNEEGKKECTY